MDASYGIGSFHTHSGDITGQYQIPGTAIVVQPAFSVNYSKNDYMMKGVEVWSEEQDRYVFTNKRRFHDDYFSLFSQMEAGVSDVRWADKLSVINSTRRSRPVPCRTRYTEKQAVAPAHSMFRHAIIKDGIKSPSDLHYPIHGTAVKP